MALLTALTGTVLPSLPPPDPHRVQAVRADLCLRPTPLPLAIPDRPDAQRWTVRAVARVGSSTDDEALQMAADSARAGLAWALGIRKPHIRAVADAVG